MFPLLSDIKPSICAATESALIQALQLAKLQRRAAEAKKAKDGTKTKRQRPLKMDADGMLIQDDESDIDGSPENSDGDDTVDDMMKGSDIESSESSEEGYGRRTKIRRKGLGAVEPRLSEPQQSAERSESHGESEEDKGEEDTNKPSDDNSDESEESDDDDDDDNDNAVINFPSMG